MLHVGHLSYRLIHPWVPSNQPSTGCMTDDRFHRFLRTGRLGLILGPQSILRQPRPHLLLPSSPPEVLGGTREVAPYPRFKFRLDYNGLRTAAPPVACELVLHSRLDSFPRLGASAAVVVEDDQGMPVFREVSTQDVRGAAPTARVLSWMLLDSEVELRGTESLWSSQQGRRHPHHVRVGNEYNQVFAINRLRHRTAFLANSTSMSTGPCHPWTIGCRSPATTSTPSPFLAKHNTCSGDAIVSSLGE